MRIAGGETRGGRDRLEAVSARPRVWVADGFVSDEEAAALLALAPEEGSAGARELGAHRNETGYSMELPVASDPRLGTLRARITALLGVENAVDDTFRFRRYAPGEAHPEHLDCYEIGGASLVFTALLHLEGGATGGETTFPSAETGPLSVAPRAGRLVVWSNHLPEGPPDPASSHVGAPLESGQKTTLTWFVYAPIAAAAHTPGSGVFAGPAAPQGPGRRFFYLDDGVPAETTELFAEACRARGVAFCPVDVHGFDFSEPTPLEAGDLLYRAAVSGAANKAEQHLFTDGVATLYHDPWGVYFDTGAALALFARAGAPAPRSIYCHTTSRERLAAYADALGGFPLLAKFPGASGGVNVVLIESMQGLYSFVDHAIYNGSRPVLTAYIPDAEHWRVVVVGQRPVAAYLNQVRTGDFRTYDAERPEDYRIPEDPELLADAVRAVAALRVEFGGVDILRHSSGRHYILEANFPCYFAPAQTIGGFDVAGAIVEHLQAKARRQVEESLGQTRGSGPG